MKRHLSVGPFISSIVSRTRSHENGRRTQRHTVRCTRDSLLCWLRWLQTMGARISRSHGGGRQGDRRRLLLDDGTLGIEPESPYRSAEREQDRGDEELRMPITVLREIAEYHRRQRAAEIAGHVHH